MSEVDVLKARLAAVEARLSALESGGAGKAPGGEVADEADIDSQYGDEVIRKDPKKWIEDGGESFASCRMSECPPEYLRAVASLHDWMAKKDEEQGRTYKDKKTGKDRPTAPFARKTAARARAWAMRNAAQAQTNGTAAPSQPQPVDRHADDEIPF